MRGGEGLGFRWKGVDLKNRVIIISDPNQGPVPSQGTFQ
jgi:hypothetical protein